MTTVDLQHAKFFQNAEERQIIENVIETFLNNEYVTDYVNNKIAEYCDELGFDAIGELTDIQEELICQRQRTIYHEIFGKVIANI